MHVCLPKPPQKGRYVPVRLNSAPNEALHYISQVSTLIFPTGQLVVPSTPAVVNQNKTTRPRPAVSCPLLIAPRPAIHTRRSSQTAEATKAAACNQLWDSNDPHSTLLEVGPLQSVHRGHVHALHFVLELLDYVSDVFHADLLLRHATRADGRTTHGRTGGTGIVTAGNHLLRVTSESEDHMAPTNNVAYLRLCYGKTADASSYSTKKCRKQKQAAAGRQFQPTRKKSTSVISTLTPTKTACQT